VRQADRNHSPDRVVTGLDIRTRHGRVSGNMHSIPGRDKLVRTHILRSAILAAAVLLPARAGTLAAASPKPPRPEASYALVGRLLAHREVLSLSNRQVTDLTALSTSLRQDRGRLRIAGHDRVPGKVVPRLERVRPTTSEARRRALDLLRPRQQAEAERILGIVTRDKGSQR